MDADTCFRRAASFLATATPVEILAGVLPATSRLREVAGLVSRVDHVGFLAPSCDETSLTSAADAAGFGLGRRTFPSTIFARELGALAGADSVSTTVFQAWGATPAGGDMLVEAFIPHDVPTDVLHGWTRAGVGTHVALCVDTDADLREVIGLMTQQGCLVPKFMNGEPLRNAAEKLAVVYLDGRWTPRPARLEFCHRG
ncbi:MAG: hypothetical protein JWP02_1197 [Acidimicrobiales bacterium]|nr:hypothetical protein [Acidimicrobiales bacterium]